MCQRTYVISLSCNTLASLTDCSPSWDCKALHNSFGLHPDLYIRSPPNPCFFIPATSPSDASIFFDRRSPPPLALTTSNTSPFCMRLIRVKFPFRSLFWVYMSSPVFVIDWMMTASSLAFFCSHFLSSTLVQIESSMHLVNFPRRTDESFSWLFRLG